MNDYNIYEIFKNIGFKVIPDPIFGKVIEMSPEDAFLFSATTGAKYLFYVNGITMKGRSEVFIHRSIFSDNYLIYSPGLFSRTLDGYLAEGNSAHILKQKYPSVFNGQKKLVIADVPEGITSNIEKDYYNKIIENNGDNNSYLLYKNFMSNIIGESFQEYLASIYFINKGYLVENQTPWFQQNYKYNGTTLQGGIPDFSAFHCSMSNYLSKAGIIDDEKGISLLVLPVIKNFRNNIFDENSNTKEYERELLIGEAKTSASSLPQAIKQLDKYKAVDIADEFFTIIPNSHSNDKHGSMSIISNSISFSSKNKNKIVSERTMIDNEWMDTYVKMLLLGNLKFDSIIEFINSFRKSKGLELLDKYQSIHLLDAIQNTTNKDFMLFFKEEL